MEYQKVFFKDDKGMFEERPDIESIVELPFKSRYRVFCWFGSADGTNLTQGFDLGDVVGRAVVLKSFSIYPYTDAAVEDFFVEDSGATEQWSETIPTLTRVNRIFDQYNLGTFIKVLVNGIPLGIFSSDVNPAGPIPVGYPLDLSLDNIYSKFPKVQTWDIQITARHASSLQTPAYVVPNVKVVCECYLL